MIHFNPHPLYLGPPSDPQPRSRSSSIDDDDDSSGSSTHDPVVVTPVLAQTASPAFIDFSMSPDDYNLLQYSPIAFSPDKRTQFVDPVANSSFLHSLSYPKVSTATGFFITHHAQRKRLVDHQKGFMDLLEDLYESCSPSSLIHKATYALSLGALSNFYQSVPLRLEARMEYARALRDLGLAVKDPSSCATDETLMTILICSYYEVRFRTLISLQTDINSE
jgi:hypothetical protein